VGICKITILIIHQVTSMLVTPLEVIYSSYRSLMFLFLLFVVSSSILSCIICLYYLSFVALNHSSLLFTFYQLCSLYRTLFHIYSCICCSCWCTQPVMRTRVLGPIIASEHEMHKLDTNPRSFEDEFFT
jgi:hypothetical protein